MTVLRWCSFGFAVLLIFAGLTATARAEVQSIVVDAKPVTSFDLNDKNRTRFGALEFVGGLAMRSSSRDFGAISGMRIRQNGQFTAVTDTGFWIAGNIRHSKNDKPSGLDNVKIAPLLNSQGTPFGHKWRADAESLTFVGASVYVGMEQDSRIIRFSAENALLTASSERVTSKFGEGIFGFNNGFESIATFPLSHPLAGNLLALRETKKKGAYANSPITGFIFIGQEWLPISIVARDGFSITDADFLPSGDLLIMERLFSMSRGVNIRIRRINGIDIKPGALLDGTMIFEAKRGQQVDNMEGLSVFKAPDGSVRIGMVSDNNHWLLQRNLYLEFRLVD